MPRVDGRKADELRPLVITRHFLKHAEGSVLIELGDTKVVCAATIDERVPQWMRGGGRGSAFVCKGRGRILLASERFCASGRGTPSDPAGRFTPAVGIGRRMARCRLSASRRRQLLSGYGGRVAGSQKRRSPLGAARSPSTARAG